MKEMLKKTWVKVIGAILLFLAGIFILGKCEKASAANFTLADGTISQVKYNDPTQILEKDGFNGMSVLHIQKGYDGFIFILIKTFGTEIASNCTRENDTFTCTHWTNIPDNSSIVDKESASYYTIYADYVSGGMFLNYTIRKTYDQGVTDGLASGSANYEQGFTDGQNSVDITTDNQNAIDSYIANNNMKTENEYLTYGKEQYQKGVDSVDLAGAREESYNNGWANGYVEGVNSVDKTTDNQAYADQYIIDNNYHTNEEYLTYGEQQYNKGKEDGISSVDITTDNQSYANQYIVDNNYKSYNDYVIYGDQQYIAGINYSKTIVLEDSKSYTTGYDRGYIVGYDIGVIDGFNSADITSDNQEAINKYISDNNMKTELDYLLYGNQKYNEGVSSVDITTDNQEYTNQYIINNNYHDHEEYLEYGEQQKQDGINSVDITSNDAEVYRGAFLEGESQGYEKAVNDGKSLGTFIPNLLGGFGSFFLTILNIDILGFNLLSVLGILITILGLIVVIKFLKG